jgi:hypothetical protein
LVAHDDRLVRHGGHVGAAGGARTEHRRDLRGAGKEREDEEEEEEKEEEEEEAEEEEETTSVTRRGGGGEGTWGMPCADMLAWLKKMRPNMSRSANISSCRGKNPPPESTR